MEKQNDFKIKLFFDYLMKSSFVILAKKTLHVACEAKYRLRHKVVFENTDKFYEIITARSLTDPPTQQLEHKLSKAPGL